MDTNITTVHRAADELSKAHAKNLKKIESNEGENQFDVNFRNHDYSDKTERQRLANSMADSDYQNAIKALADFDHPQYKATSAMLMGDCGGDLGKLKDKLKDRAIKMFDAEPLELRNSAYENSVFSGFHCNTTLDVDVRKKFMDFMNTAWKATGTYKNDKDLTEKFFKVHPFSDQKSVENLLSRLK